MNSDEDVDMEIEQDDDFQTNFADLHGRRYSCSAHNLQLCLFYGIRSTLESEGAFKSLLKLQNSFSHSASARASLKDLGKLYKKFCKTRWGSWIDVVKRYLEIKDNMRLVRFTSFQLANILF